MRASTSTAPAGVRDAGPDALQILTTGHWSLLAARSMGLHRVDEPNVDLIAALTGAVVALALVAQATDFGTGFVALRARAAPGLGEADHRGLPADHRGPLPRPSEATERMF